MPDFRDIAKASSELAVTAGIVEAAVHQSDAPDEVKENLSDKVEAVVDYLERETQEFIEFGEAYDRE